MSLYFNRAYELTIYYNDGNSPVTYRNLDIRFEIVHDTFSFATDCKVSILGISREHINALLATSVELSKAAAVQNHGKRIVLKAGYAGHLFKILDGYVFYASCDSPPNMWVHLDVTERVAYTGEVRHISIVDPTPVRDVCEKVCQEFGKTLNWNVPELEASSEDTSAAAPSAMSPANIINTFRYDGGITGALQKLKGLRNFDLYQYYGIIYARSKNPNMGTGKTVDISRDTGLISVSSVTALTCTATTFMQDPSGGELSFWMKVDSRLNPYVNNRKFWVKKRIYKGHFRGREWFSTFVGEMGKDS